jgi:hypothetical protein
MAPFKLSLMSIMYLYISNNILKHDGDWAQIVAWRCPVDMDGVWEIVRVDDWTRDPDNY